MQQHQGNIHQSFATALRTPNSTLLGDQEGKQGETRGVNLSPQKVDTPSKKGKQEAVKGESRGENGRQDPQEADTIQQRGTRRETRRETRGDNGRQAETRGDNERHVETRETRLCGRAGRQGDTRREADTPHLTKAREGRHTIQQRETRRGTRGQGETRGKQNHREGGHTSRETLGKADTPSNTKAESLRTPKSSLFGDGRRQGRDKTGKADTTTQRDTRRETNEERQGANKTGEADTTTQGDI